MKIAFITYGSLENLTGGYLYNQKVVNHLKNKGILIEVIGLKQKSYFLNVIWNFWLYFNCKIFDLIMEDELVHPAVFLFNRLVHKKVKVVALVHLLQWLVQKPPFLPLTKTMEKQMLKYSHLIVANSNYTAEKITQMGLRRDKVKVVYPGYDLAWLNNQDKIKDSLRGEKINLLFVANCLPHKGLHFLIPALHLAKNKSFVLDIVGDYSIKVAYVKKIKRDVKKYGLEEQVFWRGKVSREEIGQYYSRADIFVLPSLKEAFGLVLLEAMAFGLPVVASEVGGIPEVVEHQKTGLLVPPKDIVALSQAITILIEDENLRRQYGRKGKKKLASFLTWEEVGENFYRLVKVLLSNKQKQRKIPKR
jgi:glycosyltransferase involved in cell wall biosynthesis